MVRKYIRPPWIAREVANRITARFGTPVLEVVGRRSGKIQKIPLNVLEIDGNRYLVSPRGQTDWALNLREAGTARLHVKGRIESISVTEVADTDKPEIIEAYKERWLGPTKGQWKALPDPADHPVFRIEVAPS